MTDSPPSLQQLALKLQAYLASDAATTGLLADLRRLDPKAPTLAALASVMQLMPDASVQTSSRWLAVAKAFALVGPKMHRGGRSLGAALCAAGVSELRFERLLAAPDEHLDESVWRICRLARAKEEHFDLVDLARLILFRDPERALEFRLALSRAYLRERRHENTGTNPAVAA